MDGCATSAGTCTGHASEGWRGHLCRGPKRRGAPTLPCLTERELGRPLKPRYRGFQSVTLERGSYGRQQCPCLPQVFPQELGILAAPTPRTYTHLCAPSHSAPGREAPSLGGESARSPKPVDQGWARRGRGWGNPEGPGKASYERQTSYKVTTPLTWMAKDWVPQTFPRPSPTQSCDPHVPPPPLSGFSTTTLLPASGFSVTFAWIALPAWSAQTLPPWGGPR